MATLFYLTMTYFDFGALKRLPKTLAGLGIKRPLIATDRGLRQAGILAKVEAAIGGPATVFDGTPENPTESAVMDAVALYRQERCDGIVAVGGGSPIDLGKAVALMATSDRPLLAYAGV